MLISNILSKILISTKFIPLMQDTGDRSMQNVSLFRTFPGRHTVYARLL